MTQALTIRRWRRGGDKKEPIGHARINAAGLRRCARCQTSPMFYLGHMGIVSKLAKARAWPPESIIQIYGKEIKP